MNTNITKSTFVLGILILLPIQSILSVDNSWKDKYDNSWDYDQPNNEIKPFVCNESFENCGGSKENVKNIVKKKLFTSDTQESYRKIPLYHSVQVTPCSCGMDYRLLDLGPMYYPRYIQTGICKKEACGTMYRCKERYYKIRVLKEKDMNSESQPGIILPPSLRDLWTAEFINAVVACECTPFM